jgi:hypothetical protein
VEFLIEERKEKLNFEKRYQKKSGVALKLKSESTIDIAAFFSLYNILSYGENYVTFDEYDMLILHT